MTQDDGPWGKENVCKEHLQLEKLKSMYTGKSRYESTSDRCFYQSFPNGGEVYLGERGT